MSQSYCRQCTNNQLKNVLVDEANRWNRTNGEGEVAQAARELYWAAREECARRSIDPDEVLRDNRAEAI